MVESITVQTSTGPRSVPKAPPERSFSLLHNLQQTVLTHNEILNEGLAEGKEEQYRNDIEIDTEAIAALMRLIPGLPEAETKWLAEREKRKTYINQLLNSLLLF